MNTFVRNGAVIFDQKLFKLDENDDGVAGAPPAALLVLLFVLDSL